MKANLIDIQIIYREIPNTFIFEGVRIDNYRKSEDHFLHGWREVVIPEINSTQKLGNEYVLINDIVTKEVIELTPEEIREITIPAQISRMKFIMQVFITTQMKYEDIIIFITELPVNVLNDDNKYLILTRLGSCTHFERYSTDLLTISQMMQITTEQLDEIFINGNLIE
jgi:hypothetical protein